MIRLLTCEEAIEKDSPSKKVEFELLERTDAVLIKMALKILGLDKYIIFDEDGILVNYIEGEG